MSEELVLISRPTATTVHITLNDPPTRNAMSEAMAARFTSVIGQLVKDPEVRVVVLTGAGSVFSGGGHLDMLFDKTKLSKEENRAAMERFYASFLCLRDLPVPVIAAVNGHAIGAGLCIALACDIRLASNDAKLGLNFVHLGLHPGMGATYFLPRLVGPAKAAELLYAGKILTASEAAAIGMVNHAMPGEELKGAVEKLAAQIASAGPQAVRSLKASLGASMDRSLQECLSREAAVQAEDYIGPQFLEGITAAKEKRAPAFK